MFQNLRLVSTGLKSNSLLKLKTIEIEDLLYIERDLCFYELISLGFLLFGNNTTSAAYVLQKLLVCSHAHNHGSCDADLLRKYANNNPNDWHGHIIEALAIIGARRVLRKMGFQWEEVRQHYLPHLAEVSLHIHPLLKALYKMCERLTPVEAGRLVPYINKAHERQPNEHLRFYDYTYLEVFLLDWITRRIICVGDCEANGANMQVLLQYFKLNEMDEMKSLLIDTINSNAQRTTTIEEIKFEMKPTKLPQGELPLESTLAQNENRAEFLNNEIITVPSSFARTRQFSPSECYTITREQAGILLIINQKEFHEETANNLKDLLPKTKLTPREGTDVDKHKLEKVFTSFGYKPQEHENLTNIEMLHQIRETVKRSLLKDSLIVCILSHGIDGAVYGSNSIPVKIADIEKIITANTLLGKPKMLIIQACQKDESPTVVKSQTASSHVTADAFVDMVKAMSTVPGYVSLRHTTTGTWFIQELCDAVDKFGEKQHMLDILTIVTRNVSSKRGERNESMVPITSNTLTKYFFLPPRSDKLSS